MDRSAQKTSRDAGDKPVAEGTKDVAPQRSSAAIFRRLLRYMRPYLGIFIAGALCSVVASTTDAAFASLTKPLTDRGFSGQPMHGLWVYPLAIIGLFVVRGVFTFINSYAMSYVGNRILVALRREMFDRLITLPTAYFDDHASSSIVSRIVFE